MMTPDLTKKPVPEYEYAIAPNQKLFLELPNVIFCKEIVVDNPSDRSMTLQIWPRKKEPEPIPETATDLFAFAEKYLATGFSDYGSPELETARILVDAMRRAMTVNRA